MVDDRTWWWIGAALGGPLLCTACGYCGGSSSLPVVEEREAGLVDTEAQDADRTREEVVARLRKVRGDVRWQAASAASWSRAEEDQALRQADAVQTMPDGSTELLFILTGSFARLGPNTTLRVPDQPPRVTRFKHLRGRLVARLSSASESRMEVELPPGTLVLDRPEVVDETNEETTPEAHVEIAETKTAVTMIRGEGTLERIKRSPVKIAEQHFIEVDTGGEVVAQGVNPPLVTPTTPSTGSTVNTRGQVRFAWAAVEGIDVYIFELTKSSGEVTRHRVEAPSNQVVVELESGEYQWIVLSESSGRVGVGGEPSFVTVVVDRSPPRLEISSPPIGVTVRGSAVRVSGLTEPRATVEVNGQRVSVNDDGTFSTDLVIRRGISNVVVRAVDELGNARAVSRTVLRE